MLDVAMHIGQTEVAALVTIGEPGVVHAECVQDRGLKVMHMP